MEKRHKLYLLRFCLLLGSLCFCLLLLLCWFGWKVHRQPFHRSDLRFDGDWPLTGDDEIGYVALKNCRNHSRKLKLGLDYHIYTDERGARVNAPEAHSDAASQMVIVGGSFAYGYGMENEHTFGQLAAGHLGIAAVNLAQVGYGTLQSLQMLRRNNDLQPRVVVYGFIADHARRNLSPCAPSGAPYCLPVSSLAFPADGAVLIRPPDMSHFSPEMNWRYYREILTADKVGFNDILWRMRIDVFRVVESRSIAYDDSPALRTRGMSYLLAEMAAQAKAMGARLVVMYIPYLNPERIDPPPTELLAALPPEVLLLDLAPALQSYVAIEGNPPLAFPIDNHPNRQAHALMAAELARLLTDEHLLAVP